MTARILFALLVLHSLAFADDLSGAWRTRKATHDGRPVEVTLQFKAASQNSWRVDAALVLPSRATESLWSGVGTRVGDRIQVRLGARRGVVGVLAGKGGAAGTAHYTLGGGELVGGWTLGARSGEEVFVRDEERPPTLRPARPQEAAEGQFGTGSQAWPQLNADHPEVLTTLEAAQVIVVSSFPPAGRKDPGVHLDVPFEGPFRVFTSNQNRTGQRVWQVVVLGNLDTLPVKIQVEALTSASTREAPYVDLAPGTPAEVVLKGLRPSGPGEAAASRALVGAVEGPGEITLAAGAIGLLSVRPLQNREERMTHAHLVPSGKVAAAVLYLAGPRPTVERVRHALEAGRRVVRSGHDRIPTEPGAPGMIFGRVAGVVEASHWTGLLTNDVGRSAFLTVPGEARTFYWNSKHGSLGAAQAGRLRARLPDSSFRSWGNYGGSFALRAPLRNRTKLEQRVSIFVDSPEKASFRAIRQGFELRVSGAKGKERRYARISQRMGTHSRTPLFQVNVPAGSSRDLTLRAIYSANNTAPNPVRLVVTPAQ